MIKCDKIIVEGQTEKELLKGIGYNEEKILVSNGKNNIIKIIKEKVPEEEGNVCLIIDGDEEGYEKIKEELIRQGVNITEANPPYIKKCKDDRCYTLIVIGRDEEDYKGCIETLLNELLPEVQEEKILNEILEYKKRKMGKLSLCEEEKIKFYLKIFLLSDNVSTLYIQRTFVNEAIKIIGEDKIRSELAKFILLK